MITTYSKHDFPEDCHFENGNYHNSCSRCDKDFIGFKGRDLCKRCTDLNLRDAQNIKNLLKNSDRYEFLRTLNVKQFQDLFKENLNGKMPFDELIDREMKNGK